MTMVEFSGKAFLKIGMRFSPEIPDTHLLSIFFIHVTVQAGMYILAEMAVRPVEKQEL